MMIDVQAPAPQGLMNSWIVLPGASPSWCHRIHYDARGGCSPGGHLLTITQAFCIGEDVVLIAQYRGGRVESAPERDHVVDSRARHDHLLFGHIRRRRQNILIVRDIARSVHKHP